MTCHRLFTRLFHSFQSRGSLVVVAAYSCWVVLAGCTSPQSKESAHPTPVSQSGIASWYGPGFHGKKTTSGAVYDQNALTAAHQTLPLGSSVRVTNLTNRKTVEVRINDRGPFAKGRIIDLSHAAAERVAMVGPGTAPVLVEVLDDAGHGLTRIPDRLDYTLQLASFSDLARAKQVKEELEQRYERPVSIHKHNGYFRVQMGTFSSHAEALHYGENLGQATFTPVVVEKPLEKM